jgi:osmotically-inducible protein OsmY
VPASAGASYRLKQQGNTVNTHEHVKRDVEQELLWDRGVDARAINVKFNGGTVTLNGTVLNSAQKSEALRAAQRAAPDVIIHDNLIVRCPDNGHCADATLADQIRATIEGCEKLRHAAIDVAVTGGRATLTGLVDSPAQRDEATVLLRDLPGIVDIENRIVTRLGEAERTVADSIATALQGAGLHTAESIIVDVRDCIVRLTGNCSSTKQKEVACEAAWKAKGVRWVVDQLHIV